MYHNKQLTGLTRLYHIKHIRKLRDLKINKMCKNYISFDERTMLKVLFGNF